MFFTFRNDNKTDTMSISLLRDAAEHQEHISLEEEAESAESQSSVTVGDKLLEMDRAVQVLDPQVMLERSWCTANQDFVSFLATSGSSLSSEPEGHLPPPRGPLGDAPERIHALVAKGGMEGRDLRRGRSGT